MKLSPSKENDGKTNVKMINTRFGLKDLAIRLGEAEAVAVDLEADSMYHFKEKVCLIQMAFRGFNAIIDPLVVKDLSCLKPFFINPDILKIFHGADYDVRSLYRDYGIEINGLFDTELACRFLGMERTSLETVVFEKFNVRLNKKYQKKDWSMRPLPQEMLSYAARDVIFLLPLWEILQKELTEASRLEWLSEEFFILSRVRHPEPDGKPLFVKFKGAGKLDPRSLAVLESLLIYRKTVAKKKGKPLFWIMGSPALMKIALAKPQKLEDLVKIGVLSRKQEARYAKGLVNAVNQGLVMPEEQLPVYPKRKLPRINSKTVYRIKTLKIWRQTMADHLKIEPGLVCNNALVLTLAQKQPNNITELKQINGMKKWQRKVFGKDIIKILKSTNKD